MVMRPEDGLLTIADAARLLKVSVVTVKRWLKQGRLHAYRVGPRSIRIKREDLNALVRPAWFGEVTTEKAHEDLFVGYDPEKVRQAIARTAGSWADVDAEKLIADLYRAREEGSRIEDRP